MKKLNRRDFLRLSTVAAAGAAVAACAKTEEPTKAPVATATKAAAADPTATPVPEVVFPKGDVPRNRTVVRMFTGIDGDVGKGHC